MAELKCVVVTPERAVVDVPADFVAVPLYDGELGVLPGRAPLIGRLGAGELRIRRGTQTSRYFVDGGFVQVRSNVVTVLTPRAMKAEEVDAAAAKKALEEALKPVAGDMAQKAAQKAQDSARAQLRIAAGVRSPGQPTV
jgi:F-type H+-transporting ATPase subunit epsilon